MSLFLFLITVFFIVFSLISHLPRTGANASTNANGTVNKDSGEFVGEMETQAHKNADTNARIIEAKAANALLPDDCKVSAHPDDHLLFEFAIEFSNGTIMPKVEAPQQRYYFPMSEHVTSSRSIYKDILGMCEGTSKKISAVDRMELLPFLGQSEFDDLKLTDNAFSLVLKLAKATPDADFKIFGLIRSNKWEEVYDMIEKHEGINAVDEWGQSLLILAVINQYEFVVPPLLNSRLPKVNVNFAKHNGMTALFYAVEKPKMFSTFQALLKKGADPNIRGPNKNTPLHIACLLEKPKYAEILLEYGASLSSENEFGQTPSQLVPRDATPSVRAQFSKMFKEAREKEANRIDKKLPGVGNNLKRQDHTAHPGNMREL